LLSKKREKKWNSEWRWEERKKGLIDRWWSLVKEYGFLFVKWQPSLFIRFVSFRLSHGHARMNAFECPLKRLYQMKFNLTETTSCIHHAFCIYIHICVYLCVHCIIITELNLSNIVKRKKRKDDEQRDSKRRIFVILFLKPSNLYP
jgi:hypothetical protein